MKTVEELDIELTCARLAVNDWHDCATQEELGRWRGAQQRLIQAARLRASYAVQWQPIETAPKDRTPVLGYCDISGSATSNMKVTFWGRFDWLTVPGQYAWHPTNWMPLPEPPNHDPSSTPSPSRTGEERMSVATLPGLRYVSQGAEFDEPDRVYRYKLYRYWGELKMPFEPWRVVTWIMLNPSTADEDVLDPTLRRVEGFTRAWGYDGFVVVNLFALRSPDPKRLYDTYSFGERDLLNPVGEGQGDRNDRAIAEATGSDLVVCGWGGEKIARERAKVVRYILRDRELFCLGVNQDGTPRHPLYLPKLTTLERFA